MRLAWSNERMNRLVTLWTDHSKGMSAVARELGVHVDTAKRKAKRLGLKGRRMSSDEAWLKARRTLLDDYRTERRLDG